MSMSARKPGANVIINAEGAPGTQRSLGARISNILLWFLQITLAITFLIAGWAKLSDALLMVTLFEQIGQGEWLRYLTGTLEIMGAFLLLVPKFPGIGTLLLIPVMAGAVLIHLVVLQDGNAVAPAAILFGLLTILAWGRRDMLRSLLPNLTPSTP